MRITTSALLFSLAILIIAMSDKYLHSGTLEIYTCENIYFVDGLTITDEVGTIDSTFAEFDDLNNWLVDRMVDELKTNCE